MIIDDLMHFNISEHNSKKTNAITKYEKYDHLKILCYICMFVKISQKFVNESKNRTVRNIVVKKISNKLIYFIFL